MISDLKELRAPSLWKLKCRRISISKLLLKKNISFHAGYIYFLLPTLCHMHKTIMSWVLKETRPRAPRHVGTLKVTLLSVNNHHTLIAVIVGINQTNKDSSSSLTARVGWPAVLICPPFDTPVSGMTTPYTPTSHTRPMYPFQKIMVWWVCEAWDVTAQQ